MPGSQNGSQLLEIGRTERVLRFRAASCALSLSLVSTLTPRDPRRRRLVETAPNVA